ncbi:hydroxysqualene dehydroxylase HpnE [Poriferisphaera sp. WC338]|uniref:hydroxysqualene dehydroxylase HpnE n=1 Tax=Poriferisphaera sp. WC338 TaxID=3425129 RepID=UPI003D815618
MTEPFTYNPAPPPNIPRGTFDDLPVLIAGGGVAGIAAAIRLAEYHVPVTLIETRPKLGGRATSFVDPTTSDVLDNCQHVLMGCCTNLIDLYKRLSVYEHITWHPEIYFHNGTSIPDVMRSGLLPAPLHLTASFLKFKSLTRRDKYDIARASSAIIRTSFKKRNDLDSLPFLDWLKKYKQSDSVIKKYWEPVIVSACNETLDKCSSRYALQVFQEGFLHHKDAWLMGTSDVPLLELYDPAEDMIRRAGGTLRLTTPIDKYQYDQDHNKVNSIRLSRSQESINGAALISAVPFDRLEKLSSSEMVAADPRLQHLNQFSVSPIIGIHIYAHLQDNTPITELPHIVLTDSPIQWVFNKGMIEEGGQRLCHLHCVISAAHDLVDKPASELADLAETEIKRIFPVAQEADFLHTRAVKEKRATFSVTAGLDRYRPGAKPNSTHGIENLFIAGDWTDIGWPATMEGAARSGYQAAHAALMYLVQQLPAEKQLHAEGLIPSLEKFLPPELPSSPIYGSLSRLPG